MTRLKIGDREYEIVSSDDWTLGEWQRVLGTTGLRPAAYQDALRDLDPECWTLFLTVSIERAGKTPDEKQLASLNLLEVVREVSRQEQEEDATLPPLGGTADSGSSGKPNCSRNDDPNAGATLSLAMTPAGSGV